jgi:hypothetical protein
MATGTTIEPYANGSPPASIGGGVLAIADTMQVLKAVRTFVKEEFVDGLDFGVIPGTGGKKSDAEGEKKRAKNTLLLPGAQKAFMYFNCYPTYDIITHELGNGHVEYQITTTVHNRSTGQPVGSGIGSCSTMETKYRFRNAGRVCPKCGEASIIQTQKGKNPGGYWCVPDKGGCGANFNPGDPTVEKQTTGKIENSNIHDVRNTVLKMSKKRSAVDAALGLGCLSELFTQDLEDTFDLKTMGEVPNDPPTQSAPRATSPEKATSGPAKASGIGSWAENRVAEANAAWGSETDDHVPLCENRHQLVRHLGKFAEAEGLIKLPEKATMSIVCKALDALDDVGKDVIMAEAQHYLTEELPTRRRDSWDDLPDELDEPDGDREPGSEG